MSEMAITPKSYLYVGSVNIFLIYETIIRGNASYLRDAG